MCLPSRRRQQMYPAFHWSVVGLVVAWIILVVFEMVWDSDPVDPPRCSSNWDVNARSPAWVGATGMCLRAAGPDRCRSGRRHVLLRMIDKMTKAALV